MREITNEFVQDVMLSNMTLLNMFPFLNTLRAAKNDLAGCPPCQQGTKGAAYRTMLSDVKNKLALMSDADAVTFKQALGLDAAVIFYPAQVNGMYIRQKRVF